jgi:hypothetical protein
MARKIRSGVARDGGDLRRQEFPEAGASTIRRELASMGLHGRRRRKKPLLTKKHVAKRVSWARDHQDWEMAEWGRVFFTDESKFLLFGSDGIQYCQRGPNEEFSRQNVDPCVKHGGGKIMVWGGIHSTGFGRLVRIDGIMTGKMYCDILQEGVLGSLSDLGLEPSDIIFQQDNDPKHTSRVALAWIEENLDETLPWPPNSPDMSIIEHVWDILGVRVQRRNPRPTNIEQLWAALQEEWNTLGMDYLDKLYESMPERVAELKKAKGHHTPY